jgi:hypothetical protein
MGEHASAFEAHADCQICGPQKAHIRAAEQRAAALVEQRKQFSRWRAWHREHRETLLAGPYARQAQKLVALLDALSLNGAAKLIEYVRAGPWSSADENTRFILLRLVDGAIAALREKHESPPFDGALAGEPLAAFNEIREVLA